MIEVINDYNAIINKINNLIRGLKTYPKINSKFDLKDDSFNQLLDKILFISLAELDLIIGLKYLKLSALVKNEIEANYFARIVALSTHEIIQSTSKFLGKEIRDIIIEKFGQEKFQEIANITKEITRTSKTEKQLLGIIRNNLIAHKDENSLLQTELMISINNQEIFTLGNKVSSHLIQLIEKYVQLLNVK
jgi:hypothetical protein